MNAQTATPATIDLATIKRRQQVVWGSGISDPDNTIPIESWNTVLFEKSYRFRYILTQGLSGHSDELFRRKPIRRVCACLMWVVVLPTRPGALRHR